MNNMMSLSVSKAICQGLGVGLAINRLQQ